MKSLGHELVIKTLKCIVKNPSQSPHSIILQGEFGTGKTTCSRILARALNCRNRKSDGDACGECSVCTCNIDESIYYEEYDSAMVGSVDAIRNLRQSFYFNNDLGWKIIVFDECIGYGTLITCYDPVTNKTYKEEIQNIVNSKKDIYVMSMNDNGDYEPKRVVNWFNNGPKDLYKYRFRTSYGTRVLTCTDNHIVFKSDGNQVFAKDLKLGDKVWIGHSCNSSIYKEHYINMNTKVVSNSYVESALLGTLLGDTNIQRNNNKCNSRIRIIHSTKQEEYLNEKKRLFFYEERDNSYGSSPFNDSCKLVSSYSRTNPYYTKFEELIKPNGYKTITDELLSKLDEIALAFWFMDDGSSWKSDDGEIIYSVDLSTHSFSKEDNLKLINWFNKSWGIKVKLMYDTRCSKYFLRFYKKNALKFLDIISPYVYDFFQYKLGNNHIAGNFMRGVEGLTLKIPEYYGLLKEEAVLESIELAERRCTYDLTVEDNHNYFAGDILVHNCHLMSKAAQSALLKVIEEVTDNIIFVFATTDIDKVLPTIRSRSLELRFSLVNEDSIVNNLYGILYKKGLVSAPTRNEETKVLEYKKEDTVKYENILRLIARRSLGHMRNAHMLLDQYFLLGDEFVKTVRTSKSLFLSLFIYSILGDKNKVSKSIYELQQFSLVNLKVDYENLVLEILKVGLGCQSTTDTLLLKLLSGLKDKFLAFVNILNQSSIYSMFGSDKQFQVAMYLLYSDIRKLFSN